MNYYRYKWKVKIVAAIAISPEFVPGKPGYLGYLINGVSHSLEIPGNFLLFLS